MPDILESYRTADIDTASDPKYYGFLSHTGAWYILEENTAAGTFRYCKGKALYPAAWTARAAQSYDYYSEVF